MKTKPIFTVLLTLIVSCFFITSASGQHLIDNDHPLDLFELESETLDIRTYEVSLDDNIQYNFEDAPKSIMANDAQEQAAFVLSMLSFGAGVGFNDIETLWCLRAEYYLRLALLNRSAAYGSLGLGYDGSSGDFFTATVFNVTLKMLMFTQLVRQFQQVRFIYGLLAQYGFGNYKYDDGYKPDITRLTIGALVGFQILLSQRWSLMLQSNILSYREQTTKFDGGEVKENSTVGLFNKQNIFFLTLALSLD
ncbi:hypothetical protein ACU8DI_03965 [Psychroserpens sp. BH13MA-6]